MSALAAAAAYILRTEDHNRVRIGHQPMPIKRFKLKDCTNELVPRRARPIKGNI